jgi:hypothetical protein
MLIAKAKVYRAGQHVGNHTTTVDAASAHALTRALSLSKLESAVVALYTPTGEHTETRAV